MPTKAHSLWRILLDTLDPRTDRAPNCDECFAMIELLADLAASGGDSIAVLSAARRHLVHCPNCREQHLKRLSELEMVLRNQ
jgi:hypothetical protein